jgi:hypothetical protein
MQRTRDAVQHIDIFANSEEEREVKKKHELERSAMFRIHRIIIIKITYPLILELL